MSKRSVSPIRPQIKAEGDPRDNMIRKLKEDIILARGKDKELAILENYLIEMVEKTKQLSAQTAKVDEQGRIKLELTQKTINDLKKEGDELRAEMRVTANEMREVEQQSSDLKKLLNSKLIQIQKLKKDGVFLHQQNQKLINEYNRLRSQEDEMMHEIKKLSETIRNYEVRVSDINRKIIEVKSYMKELTEENSRLREDLKKYEQHNTNIGSNLNEKEDKIDQLERVYEQKHQQVKKLVQNYIEMEHHNEKNIKEAKHKSNLAKMEQDKFNDLTNHVKKTERTIGDRTKQLGQIKSESEQIKRVNQDFFAHNGKLREDLMYCQEHLQNLLKHNSLIQEEMQNYIREDDAIISVIRRKRIIPVLNNYNSMRTSRNEQKINTNRTQFA